MWEDYNLKLVIEAQDKFSAELKKMQWEIEQIQVTAKKSTQTANATISSIKKWIAWLWLWALIVSTTKSMVTLADNLEKSKIAFTTMLWSGQKAEAMLKELSQFAQKTPFELTWIRSSAQQLLAMWVQAKDMIPTLKSLWDVSAWLSVPLERLALNYGQVIAQWKLTWKELRDFTTAWVPLLDELASMLWKSTTAIQDMISKWQISSDIMVQAFQNMSSEWWKFANLMDQQATTLSWLWSNFQDSLASLWEEIGSELLPALKDYMKAMWEWLDENMDWIKKVASEVVTTAKVIADNVIELISSIWWVVSDFASFINDIVGQITDIVAWWMTDADDVTAQWLTWMEWNWHDFFYYVQQWITAIVWSLKTALNVADSLAKTVWKKSWWEWLYEAWNVNIYKRDKKWNLIYNREELQYEKKSIFEQLKESYAWMKKYVQEWTKDVQDAWNNWLDEMTNQLEQNYVNQVTKLRWWVYSTNKTFSDSVKDFVADVNENLSDLWWDSWSWKSAKENLEELSDEMKATIKEMEEYAKESEKMRKATYEWIISWMEDAVKSAEKLADEIDDLQGKINDLNKEERWDIASAYLKAEETLKEFKKEYADIVELAQQYSKEELKNEWKDREVLWFSAKDLLEVKNAYESMQSAYAWLSDEQKALLDEQIASQRAYNDLNDIEKIKADYEEKRKIIEDELNQKLEAFQKEVNEFMIAELKKETYEKKWLDYMNYSVLEQRKMSDQLIAMYNRIAEAKAKAWMWWDVWVDGARANWWPVYSWNTYLVWEKWPELFVPSSSWNIVPNNEIVNNNWITINVSWVSVRNDNDIQSITDEIIRKIKLEKSFWIA